MGDLFDFEAQRARLSRRDGVSSTTAPTLPSAAASQAAISSLPQRLSADYLSPTSQEDTFKHIVDDIVPALNGQAQSSRYLGFVTGGVLPIAEWADNVVSRMDQNVQVHLPGQSVATDVEAAALEMLADVLQLDQSWAGRTFTTGATASNVLGLACGREGVLAALLGEHVSVGEIGLLRASALAGIEEFNVLTSGAHSSLSKAASLVGLGRRAVKEVSVSPDKPWQMDVTDLELQLKRPRAASIIVVSAGEVNTGRFALTPELMLKVSEMAQRYGAWIHVDGAFGVFARALDPENDEFSSLRNMASSLAMADSITVDGHKLLNVPYDCGMFFCRYPSIMNAVFKNPNAAYLSSAASSSSSPSITIPSPLNIGIENSRRFRALPVYAVLRSEGRTGIANLLGKMVVLARKIAAYVRDSEHYELLPEGSANLDKIFIIVLFRATDATVNEGLVEAINATREVYVSGTVWKREKAVRIAVSNWMVDVERDYAVVKDVLDCAAAGRTYCRAE